MPEPVLEIKNVSKSFFRPVKDRTGGDNNEESVVLKDFSLTIEHAKITALIGGNGTGKTTLFNIISGFLPLDTGEIIYHKDEKQHKLHKINPYHVPQLGIGRMFQDNHIFESLSVLENMFSADNSRQGETSWQAMFQIKRNKHSDKLRAEKAAHIFETLFGVNNKFWKLRNEPAGKLSFGEKRLLGLARLLMGDYPLVLLDEPTSGVNPKLFDKIAEIIRWMDEEKEITVFLIEHNMKFVKVIAEYCAFTDRGRVEQTGLPEEVLNNENVRKRYLGV